MYLCVYAHCKHILVITKQFHPFLLTKTFFKYFFIQLQLTTQFVSYNNAIIVVNISVRYLLKRRLLTRLWRESEGVAEKKQMSQEAKTYSYFVLDLLSLLHPSVHPFFPSFYFSCFYCCYYYYIVVHMSISHRLTLLRSEARGTGGTKEKCITRHNAQAFAEKKKLGWQGVIKFLEEKNVHFFKLVKWTFFYIRPWMFFAHLLFHTFYQGKHPFVFIHYLLYIYFVSFLLNVCVYRYVFKVHFATKNIIIVSSLLLMYIIYGTSTSTHTAPHERQLYIIPRWWWWLENNSRGIHNSLLHKWQLFNKLKGIYS